MKGDVREKIFGGLFGCAVGDALGVTFEGMDGDENRIPAMSGGGQFNLRKGDVSDDTLMMLALGETYCETGEFCRDVFLRKVILTLREDDTTFGRTTKTTALLLEQGCLPERVVSLVHTIFGSRTNGSVMRTIPVGLVPLADREEKARQISAFTHYDKDAGECCAVITKAAAGLVAGKTKAEVLEEIPQAFLTGNPVPSIDAVDAAKCALMCFRDGSDYADVIRRVCVLGGDTDTIGCIAGGLAGILWGVPQKWVDELRVKDRILRVAEGLADAGEKNMPIYTKKEI